MLITTLATLALLSPTAPTSVPVISVTAGGIDWHQGTFFDARGQAGTARK